ncbi:unnamed protein product [Nyctereutes procyonoides]|uniref:Male-enhanced antigen 1 n=1 Tax=Nyctereutes procyonoides TaxID=34880 RepID=A0A811ZBN9_NYCPR|nr:unnamed protein product [Nyctereutes procyonoides]
MKSGNGCKSHKRNNGLAPAFGPGRDPGDPGWNPTSGSQCMEPASPSACISASLSLSALGLHLPDPPVESEDEEEEGATGLSNHSSIPMDPEHVELVKRMMAGVSLPAPGVPAWAREISDAQWEDVVQKAPQARQGAPAWK